MKRAGVILTSLCVGLVGACSSTIPTSCPPSSTTSISVQRPCTSPRATARPVPCTAGNVPIGESVDALSLGGQHSCAREPGLLARVEVQPGEILELHEPSPGTLLLATDFHRSDDGATRPRIPANALTQLSVEQLWDLASDSMPMPDALADALLRARGDWDPPVHAAMNAMEPDDLGGGGDSGGKDGFCTREYFDEGFAKCPTGGENPYDLQICMQNRTGPMSVWREDVYWAFINVCPVQGNVTLDVTVVGFGTASHTVKEDHVRTWERRDADCLGAFNSCDTVNMKVRNTDGDRYQARFMAWEG
jgi:hypothetical protein